MNIETKADLNRDTIEGLEQLVQMNIDSANGYEYAAETIDFEKLKTSFAEVSQERRQQAEELTKFLRLNEHQVNRSGSYAAALHRCWMKCRALLASSDVHAVLAEVARGEDEIRKAYEDVLRISAGSAVNNLLTQQYAKVKEMSERIRGLKNEIVRPAGTST